MEDKRITDELLTAYAAKLERDEKSENTKAKYQRDIRAFAVFAGGNSITKESVIAYKRQLTEAGYKVRSINSMLASLNSFFVFAGWTECMVKAMRLQREIYSDSARELTREEYERLCRTAEKKGNKRLSLILQTICGTGIRVSELAYITVDAVQRGEASVSLKGKTRKVLIVKTLQRKLLKYIKEQEIASGAVFATKRGKAISRTTVWREMKALCKDAGVVPEKVFPHNLRHLFARIFYALDKDIAKLADVLGHSSIETTRIYIITTGVEHRRFMEKMHLII